MLYATGISFISNPRRSKAKKPTNHVPFDHRCVNNPRRHKSRLDISAILYSFQVLGDIGVYRRDIERYWIHLLCW